MPATAIYVTPDDLAQVVGELSLLKDRVAKLESGVVPQPPVPPQPPAPDPITLSIAPVSASVKVGESLQFQATTNGAKGVEWRVLFAGGPSSSVGAIDQSGLFTAGSVPADAVVKATSLDDSFKFASATVRITAPIVPPVPDPGPNPPQPPVGIRLRKASLVYKGAFRVPHYKDAVDQLALGGAGLAYNAAKNSLFISGFHNGSVCEISVPELSLSKSQADLKEATILQGFRAVLPDMPVPLYGDILLGGLLVYEGKLIGTVYAYYTGANDQATSHFVFDSLDLTTAKLHGLYKPSGSARFIAGAMATVPAKWQPSFGPAITGQADLSILATTSSGPSVFGFDPSQLVGPEPTTVFPVSPLLYYPADKPLAAYGEQVGPIQAGTTSITGKVFVGDSILFFGKTGTNWNGYGEVEWYNDPAAGGKGPHSMNGEYTAQVWAYDANDLASVKQGAKQPWEVMPYEVWNFEPAFGQASKLTGGVAYDEKNGLVYLAMKDCDYTELYDHPPIILVFAIDASIVDKTPAIGTLCAVSDSHTPHPSDHALGLSLHACNCYDGDGSGIKTVEFYDGPKLLGVGTPGVGSLSHDYSLVVAAGTFKPGTVTITALARTNAGAVSNPISYTFGVK